MDTTTADTWQALLAAHSRITDHIDSDLTSEVDMTLAEFEVLDHLARSEDLTVRMNELATLVRLSPSGLTRRFDTLVRRGLVVREPCSNDRRGINARLTPLGLQRHAAAAIVHERGVQQYVLAHLDPHELICLTTTLAAARYRERRSRTAREQHPIGLPNSTTVGTLLRYPPARAPHRGWDTPKPTTLRCSVCSHS